MGAALLATLGTASGAATAFQVAAPVLGGISAFSEAQGEKKLAETNAYIGRTRAMQTNVSARESLNSELGSLRATFATNNQRPGVGTDSVFRELRQVRSRERRIEFGNDMAAAADFRMRGQNALSARRGALLGGLIKSGPSLFDLYQLRKKQNG